MRSSQPGATMRVLFIVLLTGHLATASYAQDLPPEVAALYAQAPDPRVSDEFSAGALDRRKWAYRTLYRDNWGTGEEYVELVTEGEDRYVSIKGDWSAGKGSGITTKHPVQFGFYTTRWRTENIHPDWKTPWHPAIWLESYSNLATGDDNRTLPRDPSRVEIDWIEYWHNPVWHSQIVTWELTDGRWTHDTHNVRPIQDDFPSVETGWQTHGLEYHPDYLQLWQKLDDAWRPIGQRIRFNDEPNTATTIHREFTAEGFWVLSNKHHWAEVTAANGGNPDPSEYRFEDSSLHVDHFRYHPLLNAVPATEPD